MTSGVAGGEPVGARSGLRHLLAGGVLVLIGLALVLQAALGGGSLGTDTFTWAFYGGAAGLVSLGVGLVLLAVGWTRWRRP
jgi:hypothetical protein